jgi:hypothetical protein
MNTTQRTATLVRSYTIGPWQIPHTVQAGATVRIVSNNETGELVTIGHGNCTGPVRRNDLRFN